MAQVTTTMVAEKAARPDVLPTDRLTDTGKARPGLRHDLRHIANARNALSVASLWFWVAVLIGGAVWIGNPLAYLAAFVLMGPMEARFAILMHEAAHKLLFTNKRANDWVGTWLVAYPVFTPIALYRRGHFAHHKEEFGPKEPDMAFYGGYRCDRRASPAAWCVTLSASRGGRTSPLWSSR
jgi:fatty acid desaturase